MHPTFDAIQDSLQQALAASLRAAREIAGPSEIEIFCMGYSEREKRVLAFFAASDSATPFAIDFGILLFGPSVENEELARLRFPSAAQARADAEACPAGSCA